MTHGGELEAPGVRNCLMDDFFGDGDPFKEFTPQPCDGEVRPGLRHLCQTSVQSSVIGSDGHVHTERFVSVDVGDQEHGVREAQQAYSNSSSGVIKTAVERHWGERAVKVTKARSRRGQEEQCEEMRRGIEEGGREAFEREFAKRARYLPPRPLDSAAWSDLSNLAHEALPLPAA